MAAHFFLVRLRSSRSWRKDESRYNNRSTPDNPLTDADRFALAVSQVAGKRLTYAELTGKVGESAV